MSKNHVCSISDINDLAAKHGMPLEKMRFFIGVDNPDPKCFGIYQDQSGEWVVYKNKANGERAERYRGYDEAEASQIIWDKIEDEIKKRKKDKDWWQHQQDLTRSPEYAEEYEKELESRALKPNYGTRKPKKKNSYFAHLLIIVTVVALISSAIIIVFIKMKPHYPQYGYYTNNDSVYYYQSGDWYYWDSGYDDWYLYDYDTDTDNWSTWDYGGTYYNYDYNESGYTAFEDSDYYQYSSSSDSSDYNYDDDYDSDWSDDWDYSWESDDDYDYDYDDWDSGDTDWDSDW